MDIGEKLDRIRKVLYAGYPDLLFISIFMSEYVPKNVKVVKEPNFIAGVDGKFFYVNHEKWEGLSIDDQKFVFVHAGLHTMLSHPIRALGKHPIIWNIATDCVINRYLRRIYGRPSISGVFPETIIENLKEVGVPETKIPSIKFFEKSADEEIYAYLVNILSKYGKRGYLYVFEDMLGDMKDIIKPELASDEERPFQRELESKAKKAIITAGRIGGVLSGLPREILSEINKMRKPEVDWQMLLRNIIYGIGSTTIFSWKRESRRHPMLPGKEYLSYPRLFLLIDVSGSISDEEINKFLNEINYLLKIITSEICVILWSDVVVDEFTVNNVENIKERIVKAPSGGAMLSTAIKRMLDVSRRTDIGLVLTDGVFGDELNKLLKYISMARNNLRDFAIIYTTSLEPAIKKLCSHAKIKV
jgi:predicted metal-dependent peptidase